jgi:hypothetical protein
VSYYLIKVKNILQHTVQYVKKKSYNLIVLDISGEGDKDYNSSRIKNLIKLYYERYNIKTIALSQNSLACDNNDIFYYNFAWEYFNKDYKVIRSNTTNKYFYNYLGGYPRKDKILFINQLINSETISKSLVSFGTIKKDLKSIASRKTLSNTPKIIDHDMLYSKHTGEFWQKIKQEFYMQSRFSLIQETEMQHQTNRYTEKTLKAIAMKSPFIIAGNYGVLNRLRQDGFRTYHPMINEGYDLEKDKNKRINLIIKEVERLCSMSFQQWIEFESTFLRRTLNHNADNLLKLKSKQKFISSLKF